MIPYTEESHHIFAVQLYTAAECRRVVESVRSLDTWQSAQVREPTDEGGFDSFTRPEIRSTSILRWSDDEVIYKEFDVKMQSVIKPLIKQIWGVDFTEHGGTQILRYAPGGHYVAHSDAGEDLQDRYFSIVCYLNDDFEGGQTSFPFLDYAATPLRGKAIIFPSKYLHRAEPILDGEKYVLVSWVLGPTPIRWI
jgi:hypothetical protein